MHGLCMYKIHEISTIMHEYVCKKSFILYDMCMRDDYHAHISHLSGIMKRHFFPSVDDGS